MEYCDKTQQILQQVNLTTEKMETKETQVRQDPIGLENNPRRKKRRRRKFAENKESHIAFYTGQEQEMQHLQKKLATTSKSANHKSETEESER